MPSDSMPALSLWEVYTRYLVSTRVVAGIALVAGWPILLHVTAHALRLVYPRPGYFLTLIGILLGALTYTLTFLPWPMTALSAAIPPLAALGLILGTLGLSPVKALSLWFLQGAFALGLALFSVWGLESLTTQTILNPVSELPAIYKSARSPVEGPQQVPAIGENAEFPGFKWSSTGSRWLDHRANRARVEINVPQGAPDWVLSLEISGVQEPITLIRDDGSPAILPTFSPSPDRYYWLTLTPGSKRGEPAIVYSLLPLDDLAETE